MQGFSNQPFNADDISGFDYDFNSIEDDTNELFCAYREMFELAISQQNNPMRQLLGIYFPIVNVLFVSKWYQMTSVIRAHQYKLSRTWRRGQSRGATR